MDKKIPHLPKDGLSPEDARFIDENDTEGHGLPVTAPPSFGSRQPGHGGENIPSPVDDEDDVEGHRVPRW
jgi:hypothetical protein